MLSPHEGELGGTQKSLQKSSMSKVLVWPSQCDIPASISGDASAVIGWKHKTNSSCDVTVVAGVVAAESKKTAFILKRLPAVIETLSNCGECTDVISSLQILPVEDIDTSYITADTSIRVQLILYDPIEANQWLVRQNHSHNEGSWDRILMQVGLGLKVMNGLRQFLESDDLEYDEPTIKYESSDVCRCRREKALLNGKTTKEYSPSLLLLYLSRAQSKQVVCSACEGIQQIKPASSAYSSLLQAACSRMSIVNLAQALSDATSKKSTSTTAAIAIDVILGLIIGTACLTCHDFIFRSISIMWKQYSNGWERGLTWLESNPGGIKMNQALTEQIVLVVEWILNYHQQFVLRLVPLYSAIIKCAGILSITFGSRFFFAILFDLSRIGFVHITLLSSAFAAVQQFELSTLSSLWLLFRGKKRNVLRLRSDHLQYDHMQLLLGMLLFSMCIFLFTTVLVHHCFFAGVVTMHELMLCGLWLGYISVDGLFRFDELLMDGQEDGVVNMLPVSIEDRDSAVLDNVYITRYVEKTSQFNVNQNERFDKDLSSGVSLKTTQEVMTKLVFSVNSNKRTIIGAFVTFVTSTLFKMIVYLPRFLLGSPCLVISSCVDSTR